MGEPCRKCKSWRPLAGDTWCVGCSAWETVGLELVGQWSGPTGLRAIANDLVLGCAREVRALRAVGAGFGRAPTASGDPTSAPASARQPSPSGPSTASKARPSQPESEYTYEEGSEEEEARERVDKRPALLRRTPPPIASLDKAGASGNPPGVKEELRSEDRREKGHGIKTRRLIRRSLTERGKTKVRKRRKRNAAENVAEENTRDCTALGKIPSGPIIESCQVPSWTSVTIFETPLRGKNGYYHYGCGRGRKVDQSGRRGMASVLPKGWLRARGGGTSYCTWKWKIRRGGNPCDRSKFVREHWIGDPWKICWRRSGRDKYRVQQLGQSSWPQTTPMWVRSLCLQRRGRPDSCHPARWGA